MLNPLEKIDTKEVELPETLFIRDIEGKVFQSICLQCLALVEGVEPLEGNLIDSLLGRDRLESAKGIHVEQDQKNHSVKIKVELNVAYGISIPEKADEIQNKIVEEISQITGLHVGCVHVIFKNLIAPKKEPLAVDNPLEVLEEMLDRRAQHAAEASERYDEEF